MKEKNFLGLAFVVLFIILALLTSNVLLSICGATIYTFSFWWLGLLFQGGNKHAIS